MPLLGMCRTETCDLLVTVVTPERQGGDDGQNPIGLVELTLKNRRAAKRSHAASGVGARIRAVFLLHLVEVGFPGARF